ncbi:hypothetical protein [Streptomyces subrutilus]|uniref:Uncharacterized protein n=1 Tax=Streptomyces subrutilus TaxID=36818 RepID=A0A1E5PSE5_9ACTN|nr:hypothetical protein [Streptomyces subrutilus]OEJ32433.1 hypothetical protein BGK67_14835 [Streptomyces subrutilus]
MSPIAMGGPALFIGGETYVALVRPRLDPADPGVRRAADEVGVSPEEFAGPGDVWALMLDWADDEHGEGGGFELPGLRDIEAEDFAERLRAALTAGGRFTVEAGAVLRLDARPVGEDYAFTARITPPDGDAEAFLILETDPVPLAALLADLEEFRGSLA